MVLFLSGYPGTFFFCLVNVISVMPFAVASS